MKLIEEGTTTLKIRALFLAVALAVVFASTSMANIGGSTYNFTTSVTGSTQISPLGGPTSHTDPANPGFCVGPPLACNTGSGVSGSFTFNDVTATMSTITFSFFGSTNAAPGTFKIDLGNFVLPDGDHITNVTYASGNFNTGDFSSVSWNGTDAIFTGSTATNYDAINGVHVVFNVTEVTPEPRFYGVLLVGLLALAGIVVRNRGAAQRT
jgi:hypothetical protein